MDDSFVRDEVDRLRDYSVTAGRYVERYRHPRLDKWNVVQSWIVQVIRRFLIKRVEQREWQMKERERERETSEISTMGSNK